MVGELNTPTLDVEPTLPLIHGGDTTHLERYIDHIGLSAFLNGEALWVERLLDALFSYCTRGNLGHVDGIERCINIINCERQELGRSHIAVSGEPCVHVSKCLIVVFLHDVSLSTSQDGLVTGEDGINHVGITSLVNLISDFEVLVQAGYIHRLVRTIHATSFLKGILFCRTFIVRPRSFSPHSLCCDYIPVVVETLVS